MRLHSRIGRCVGIGVVIAIFTAAVAQPAWASGQFNEPYGRIESGDRSVNRRHETVAISRIQAGKACCG